MKIVITGCAGFIGFHLCLKLLNSKKVQVLGIDNLNNYYDVTLKKNRIKELKKYNKFSFFKIDISKYINLHKFFKDNKF